MPFPEHVTPGWSVTYPPSRLVRARAVERQPGRLPAERIYPSWCLVYPPPTSPPGARPAVVNSDPAECLLRQVFAS
jgi:hypothetical protein